MLYLCLSERLLVSPKCVFACYRLLLCVISQAILQGELLFIVVQSKAGYVQ